GGVRKGGEWWPRATHLGSILPRCARRNRWWPRAESNHRHKDFQSSALPTELLGHLYCTGDKDFASGRASCDALNFAAAKLAFAAASPALQLSVLRSTN